MKRTELNELASALANQVNAKPFEYWASQEYPINSEHVCQGHIIQVEIIRLESTADYIRLSIAVDDGRWPSVFMPSSADTVVKKAK